MELRGKKLRGNGIWEASRMMLPEHKSAIRTHRSRLKERARPELDEQRIEELSAALAAALASGEKTAVTAFGPLGDETSVGVVAHVDPLARRIKLVSAEETVWIPLEDIVKVERA